MILVGGLEIKKYEGELNILITNNFIESEFLGKTNLRLGLELITALCKKILTNSSIIKVNIFLKKKRKKKRHKQKTLWLWK